MIFLGRFKIVQKGEKKLTKSISKSVLKKYKYTRIPKMLRFSTTNHFQPLGRKFIKTNVQIPLASKIFHAHKFQRMNLPFSFYTLTIHNVLEASFYTRKVEFLRRVRRKT